MGILMKIACDSCSARREITKDFNVELKKLSGAGWRLSRVVACPKCSRSSPASSGSGRNQVFSDGSCVGSNPGHGGWAWVTKDSQGSSHSTEYPTTNQRMEIKAAAEALKNVKSPVTLFSDSKYVVDCLTKKWFRSWETNGWLTKNKEPVKNQDLWKELVSAYLAHDDVEVVWVKGHSDNEMNNQVDELARTAAVAGRKLRTD